MEKIKVNRILTHENPDLDGMLSVLLLRKFGSKLFDGVSQAEVVFHPAGELPGNMSPEQLEKTGTIAVDIGGGRFDSHPSKQSGKAKKTHSAADLVAKELGVIDNTNWKDFIEYARLHDTTGYSLTSRDHVHHLFALHSIIEGLTLLNRDNSAKILEQGIEIIQCIPAAKEYEAEPGQNGMLLELLLEYINEKGVSVEEPAEQHEQLITWLTRLKKEDINLESEDKTDRLVSLTTIFKGAFYSFKGNKQAIMNILTVCLDAVLERQLKWVNALKQFESVSVVEKIDKLVITTVLSENSLIIKAARFKTHPDILIYSDPVTRSVTIFIQRKGFLSNFPFQKIVAYIRLAEATENNENVDYADLEKVGSYQGWFLHQSMNLLIRGSRKQLTFVPTSLSLETIRALIKVVLDKNGHKSVPEKYQSAFLAYVNPLFRKNNLRRK